MSFDDPDFENNGTLVLSSKTFSPEALQVPLQAVWPTLYSELYELHGRSEARGYAFGVIDSGGALTHSGSIAPVDGEPAFAVLGRHSCSYLSIQGDPFLALRHLFVLVRPALENPEAGPLTLELVELRTDVGMQIEGVGKAAAALVEGAVSVGLASRRVVFLPLGGSWPKSPEVALQRFFGEPVLVVEPTHFTNPKNETPRWSDSTSVSIVKRVIDLKQWRKTKGHEGSEHSSSTGNPVGALVAQGPFNRMMYRVDAKMLERGILLGRYGRCAGTDYLFDNAVSRVHAMVRRDEQGDWWIFDCGSTYGIHTGDAPPELGQSAKRRHTLNQPVIVPPETAQRVRATKLEPWKKVWLSADSFIMRGE